MSYYFRSFFWFLQGRKSFTKNGFEKASQSFKAFDDVDVSGWNFLVTGGSTGIGKAVAHALVKRKGTTVHIVCKNEKNGQEAQLFLEKEADQNSKVFLHLVDLSEPNDVISFADKFVQENKGLNVLINNAGILANEKVETTQGFERSFSLNVIGTYILTTKLANFINSTRENDLKPRIIFVSSGGMLTQALDTSVIPVEKNFDGVAAYAQHKRQQVVLCDILSDKYPNIQFSSMHPGWVDTPGVERSLPSFYSSYKNDLRTPDQGADTIVWLAISNDALSFPSGTFFLDRAPAHKFLFSSENRYDKTTEETYVSNLEKIIATI